MPGPAPKPAAVRRRRNTHSGAATLPAAGRQGEIPELTPLSGRRVWNPRVETWWKDVWESPMATRYEIPADVHNLRDLAELKNDLYKVRKPAERVKLMQEIRMQEARFGLTPKDRAALHWEIERGEEAQEKTTARTRRTAAGQRAAGVDPRKGLVAMPGGKS